MIRSFSRFSFPSHVSLCAPLILCLAVTTGCSLGPVEADDPPDESADLAVSEEALGIGSDWNLNFVKKNGFASMMFSKSCVSKKKGAPTITTPPLPLGGGRSIECTTYVVKGSRGVQVTTNTNGSVYWCVAGVLDSLTGVTGFKGNDKRIVSTVISAPADVDGPITTLITRDGNEMLINQLPFLFGTTAWPFYVSGHYRTTAMEKKRRATTPCEEQMR